jgi:hypothetical protein
MNGNTRMDLRREVLDLIKRTGRPMTTIEIADSIKRSRTGALIMLYRMRDDPDEGYVKSQRRHRDLLWSATEKELVFVPKVPAPPRKTGPFVPRYDFTSLLEAFGMNVQPPRAADARQHRLMG